MINHTSWPECFPEDFTYGSTKAGLDDLCRRFWTRYNQLTDEIKNAIDKSHYCSRMWEDNFVLSIGFKNTITCTSDDVFGDGEYHTCEVYFFADRTEIDWIATDASGEYADLSGNFLDSDCNKEAIENVYIELFKKVPNFNDTVMNAFETLVQLVGMKNNLPEGVYLK